MVQHRYKILTIFGTRPEAIKMAPLVNELANSPTIESRVCVTAQHREMLDQVLTLFDIEPDYDLNIMQPDQALSQLSADLFSKLDPVVKEIRPDWILAQGDTTTVQSPRSLLFIIKSPLGMWRQASAPVTWPSPFLMN